MKNIQNLIAKKIGTFKQMKFSNLEELDFFDKYGNLIYNLDIGVNITIKEISHEKNKKTNVFDINNDIECGLKAGNKNTIETDINIIDIDDLFILCHRANYDDEDFSSFSKKIKDNKELLQNIISSAVANADVFNFIINNQELNFNYSVDDSLVKGSIFSDEKYFETIEKIIKIIFISGINDIYSMKRILLTAKNMTDILGYRTKVDKILKKFSMLYNKIVNVLGVNDLKIAMLKKYQKLTSDYNKFYVNIGKQYSKYLSLSKSLKKIDKLPYSIDVKLIDGIDDDIIFELYSEISKLNQKYYNELMRKKQKMLLDDVKYKKMLLKKVGYEIERVEPSKLNFLLKYGNMDELLKIIPIIKEDNLFDIYSDNGIYILVNTNYEIVLNISNLVRKNMLFLKFLESHPRIFFRKDKINDLNSQYDLVLNNLNILAINYNNESNYDNELLTLDNSELSSNIMLLKCYVNSLNSDILKNIKLIDYLDLFIELGLADYIKNHIDIVNEFSDEETKRIYIGKLIGLDDSNVELMIKTCENLAIDSKVLDDYIINNVDNYILPEVKAALDGGDRKIFNDTDIDISQFDNFLMDNLTYNFNGVLISKNKLLRNLNYLKQNEFDINNTDILYSATIYGSILDYEQLDTLKDIVFDKTNCKTKIKN